MPSVALPVRGELGPPPVETAYSPLAWSDLSDGQDSRPDNPLEFDNNPELYNPWSFLVLAAADDNADLGQPTVDPVVAPPFPSVVDNDLRSILLQRGLIQQETVASIRPLSSIIVKREFKQSTLE